MQSNFKNEDTVSLKAAAQSSDWGSDLTLLGFQGPAGLKGQCGVQGPPVSSPELRQVLCCEGEQRGSGPFK